ncbi:hypothetical protein [Streptomyces gobiensis]|uniref:hypothetical protein n=1 Tax=Streptomyces gobiensis TaxID=2875706 RepID=UPI001E5F5988|nr:hypothetical protein [Streptomyces gobiensis]UGY91544.1 hypothetical protein test1122_07270 [Streptomyces gobiensis]
MAEVVRWGAFSCALVPVVLFICGSSPGGALGTAFGLAVVTAVCRALLRRAERVSVRLAAERAGGSHRARTGARPGGGGRHGRD